MAQQSSKSGAEDPFIIIYETDTPEEALILRGLLESAGIESPASSFTEPIPLHDYSDVTRRARVMVRTSQVEDARRILLSYGETAGQRSNES